MRKILFSLTSLLFFLTVIGQPPQFAVVRPGGTTHICPTWDSAYNKSVDGDYIYLPGTTINQNIIINKRLQIYGAGHHPDSSAVTGKTTVTGHIQVFSGAKGGFIEGLQSLGDLRFTNDGGRISGFVVQRCSFFNVAFGYPGTPPDSLPTNILFNECIVTNNLIGNSIPNGPSTANSFIKNIFGNGVYGFVGSSFNNNLFLATNSHFGGNIENNIFSNNVFLSANPFPGGTASACNNSFYNNLKAINTFLQGCPINSGTEQNTLIFVSAADVFTSYFSTYPHYANNYHLQPTSIGKNAGTNGTDVGIYGTNQPTPEGWVPSNPHIYFKQVDAQTGSDGKLRLQFKVRTNN